MLVLVLAVLDIFEVVLARQKMMTNSCESRILTAVDFGVDNDDLDLSLDLDFGDDNDDGVMTTIFR